MSDHTSALVPIKSWCYMSPELWRSGKQIDIGLFAEALIYYDHVFVTLPDKWVFPEFISWFIKQDRYGDLIALLEDEVIKFYYYSFFSASVKKKDQYLIQNLQDKRAADLPVFESDCLATANLKQVLPHARQRAKLHRAIRGRVLEAKAKNFESAIENAQKDFQDHKRCALLVQALVDEIYPLLNLKEPPTVKSQVIESSGKIHIAWNIDFEQIARVIGKDFNPGMPLSAAARCNRLLWSAAEVDCDLYLQSPMSTLVGDKLYESSQRLNRSQKIIEQLEVEVEFPKIRQLVNEEQIGLKEVLELRQKGQRFRNWLQNESDRDRNALIAYHNEVAQELGWLKGGRKALALFGIVGGAAIGTAVGGVIGAGPLGSIVGSGIGAGVTYVIDLASKLNAEWRPVVFGNWARDRIHRELAHSRAEQSER